MQDHFYVAYEFHRNIIKEFATESGLLVLARGLGLNSIIKSLVHLYADPKLLVFLISSESDDPLTDLDDEKNSDLAIETAAYINRIKTDHSIKERSRIYGKGGVIILSARVFLMDLLHSRIPIPLVTGVMLQDAHKVSEYGMEAFCLYLLRRQNELAFIKAFSDDPEALIRGFSKAEKILKTLRISNLFLYPRFHVGINSELSHSRIEILEINSSLSQRMRMIQMSILGILESSIGDICKDNSLNMDDFNVNLSVLGEFDSIIRQHLESDWHRVGFKTKQLLKEIRILRNILVYSMDYDAITFYNYLKVQVEEAQGLTYNSSAYWLLSDAANVLVEVAKERATIKEINPKWKALESIVSECESSRKAADFEKRPILIVAASSQSLVRLAILLSIGSKEYLEKLSFNEDKSAKRSKTVEEAESDQNSVNLKTIFDIEAFFERLIGKNIILRTINSIDAESLKMLDPHSIILYTPDLEIIRTIELFKLTSEEKIKVFFFMYKDSIEEQKYLTQVRREKEAFEKLIQTKAMMAPYNEEAGVSIEFMIEDVVSKTSFGSGIKQILSDSEFPRKIIVDTRDLRSSLPFLLYLYGFEIEPITIPIGDYILSPSICVERKSLPDLIQSLNSGRLHSQVSAMSRAYSTCILLIEFDPDKPFYLLQSRSASALRRVDLSPTDLISKLALLLIHHPKLKLLWTSGPKLTCDIFYDLKRNEPNPDSEQNNVDIQSTDSPYSPELKEILLKLPGINTQNFFLIMKYFENLKTLSTASLKELTDVLGIENGTKLHNFFIKELK